MKSKFIVVVIVFSTFFTANAQYVSKGKVGFTFSPYAKSAILGNDLPGAPGTVIYNTTGFGFSYLKPLNSTLDFETGVDYTLFKVHTISAVTAPEIRRDTTDNTLSMLQIPLAFRVNFAEILFLTGGALLDFDMNSTAPVSKQSGIGLVGGVGLNYDFKFGLSLFANPFVKVHSLIPFSTWTNHQRVMETGVRVGLVYQF